jgi:transcriptional regulator with XRE-family HTH domain
MAPSQSLPVRARRLASELKQLRERASLSVEQAAAQLNWSYSKLNRFENARAIPSPSDVGHILDLYGVGSERRESLIKLARDASKRGWWADWQDVFNGTFPGLEDEAAVIRSWQPLLIPGLLQTEDYARAVIQAGLPDREPDDIQRRVMARMARKTLLSRPGAPEFHAVLGEAVLRQEVGSIEVLHEQLRALTTAMRRPNVTVRVLPFTAGASIGLEGPFMNLEFPEPVDPAISYIEDISGGKYIEDAEGNRRIRLAFDRISDAALPPEDLAALIADIVKE